MAVAAPQPANLTMPWPAIPPEVLAGVDVLVARLDAVRGAPQKSAAWEQALADKIRDAVDEALALQPQSQYLPPQLVERLRSDTDFRVLFEWACLVKGSYLWPLSLLIYGQDCEEIRRIAGMWIIETGDGPKRIVGESPAEFQAGNATDEDVWLAGWFRQLFGLPGLTGKLQLSLDSPMAEAVVPTAKGPIRIAAAVSPIVTGTSGLAVTIRVPRTTGPQSLTDFVRMGAMTPGMALFLQSAVKARLNMLLVGDTGTGKTTLMRALSAEIADIEAIIVIEDNPELYLDRPRRDGTPYHRLVIPLGTAAGRWTGATAVTMSDLAAHALRHRGSRVLLGEARGAEMVDVLSAMTSGTDGSMVTLHARRAAEGTKRAALLASFSPVFRGNTKAAEALVHQAVHLCIHLGWVSAQGGGRKRVVDGIVAYDTDGTEHHIYGLDDRGTSVARLVMSLDDLPERLSEPLRAYMKELPTD